MKKNETKNYLSIKNVLIFWVIVILIGWVLGGLNLAIGLLVAAILSLLIIHFTLNSSWKGVIENIKTEKIYSKDPDSSHNEYKEVTYAHLKVNNGKKKKVRAYPQWKIGDKIRKEKGKFNYEKIN
jgi:predicted membrane protein